MTADQKRSIAELLDLAEDYLGAGFRRERSPRRFADDPPPGASPDGAGGSPRDERPSAAPAEGRPAGAAMAPRDDERIREALATIAEEVRACAACGLCSGRRNAVPGEGARSPLVMVIGEGPGADEDATGRPFVGPAGQLLDKMLSSIGLSREGNAFIANVVKCHPPGNRDPEREEAVACAPFLYRQIELLRPRIILAVGRVASQRLLETDQGIGKLRGRFFDYQGIPLLPTYHPSALLRDGTLKRPAWEDLKLLRGRLAEIDGSYRPPDKP